MGFSNLGSEDQQSHQLGHFMQFLPPKKIKGTKFVPTWFSFKFWITQSGRWSKEIKYSDKENQGQNFYNLHYGASPVNIVQESEYQHLLPSNQSWFPSPPHLILQAPTLLKIWLSSLLCRSSHGSEQINFADTCLDELTIASPLKS